jgi:hypothetical protein
VPRSGPRSTQRSSIALVIALGLLAACSGGSDSTGATIPPIPDDTRAELPSTAPSDSIAPQVTAGIGSNGAGADLTVDAVVSIDDSAALGEVRALVRTIDVGQTVRYAGFDVRVDDVSVGFDPGGFAVAFVRMTLTNQTPRDDELMTAVEVVSQGRTAVIDRDRLPRVPSGGTAAGAVSIRLDPSSFTFDDAVLFVGRPDRQRAQIPLGSAGELVTLTPVTLDVVGNASDDVSSITIDEVSLAWDTTDPRGQSDPGGAFLQIGYTVDSTTATVINDESVTLIGPDGSSVTGVGGSAGRVDANVPFQSTAAYPIADPPAGDYTLRYVERFDRGVVEVPFTLG